MSHALSNQIRSLIDQYDQPVRIESIVNRLCAHGWHYMDVANAIHGLVDKGEVVVHSNGEVVVQ